MNSKKWLSAILMGIGAFILFKVPEVEPGPMITAGAAMIGVGFWILEGGKVLSAKLPLFVIAAVLAMNMAWAAFLKPSVIFYLLFIVGVGIMASLLRSIKTRVA